MDEEKLDIGYGEWKKDKGGKSGFAYVSVFFLLVAAAALGSGIWSYNSLADLSEAVSSARSQIESNIQRKADLLPNLVKTVKAYAKHEEKVLGDVSRLRFGPAGGAAADMKRISSLNAQLSDAALKLMAVAESYPDLKASEQFRQLQAQIEGAENRINITRMLYNDSVREYNAALKKIPGRFLAPLLGLRPAAYFEADTHAKKEIKLDI
jgi:LemA protein